MKMLLTWGLLLTNGFIYCADSNESNTPEQYNNFGIYCFDIGMVYKYAFSLLLATTTIFIESADQVPEQHWVADRTPKQYWVNVRCHLDPDAPRYLREESVSRTLKIKTDQPSCTLFAQITDRLKQKNKNCTVTLLFNRKNVTTSTATLAAADVKFNQAPTEWTMEALILPSKKWPYPRDNERLTLTF